MVIFSVDSPDQEVRTIVTDWVMLLSEGKYQQALDMLYQDNPGTSEVKELWTPDRLVNYINNYGLEEPLPPSTKEQYEDDMIYLLGSLEGIKEWQPIEREIFWVTPITEDMKETFNGLLTIDRVHPFGQDLKYYSGMVCVNLPMNGTVSDVTAQLLVRRLGADSLALELFDLHVM